MISVWLWYASLTIVAAFGAILAALVLAVIIIVLGGRALHLEDADGVWAEEGNGLGRRDW